MYNMFFNQQLIYGKDSIFQLEKVINNYGLKALIVTGRNFAKKSGSLDLVCTFLKNKKIEYVVFDEVLPNPAVSIIDKCASLAKRESCKFVIALGGGSSIDTAKAAAVMVTNVGSVAEYLEIGNDYKRIINRALPVIAIPSTAGTGSEVTWNAVITDEDKKLKRSIRSEMMLPVLAILDPTLIKGSPVNIIGPAVMDSLTQLIEPYTGKNTQPVIDNFCLVGIKKIIDNLMPFMENREDEDRALELQIASYFSGLALANAGLGAVHALARPFSGRYNLGHGLVCAILLPYIVEKNYKENAKKYARITAEFEKPDNLEAFLKNPLEPASRLAKHIFQLNKNLNIPTDFKNFEIPEGDIPLIIDDSHGSSMNNNIKQFSKDELYNFLADII